MRTRACTGASCRGASWTRCPRATAPAVRPALLAPVRAALVVLCSLCSPRAGKWEAQACSPAPVSGRKVCHQLPDAVSSCGFTSASWHELWPFLKIMRRRIHDPRTLRLAGIIFEGIGVFDVGMACFLGRLGWLAQRWVPCGPVTDALTHADKVAVLRQRLAPVPARSRQRK